MIRHLVLRTILASVHCETVGSAMWRVAARTPGPGELNNSSPRPSFSEAK
jgi:hypothetical protein